MYRELNVLNEQMERPAAAAFQYLPAEHKSRSRNCAARSEQITGVVEVFCLAQEPQRVACGYPVIAVVFRVSVACDYPVAVGEGLVHAAYVVLAEKIIRIEHHVCVEYVAVFLAYPVKQIFKSIALADELIVKALVHYGSVCTGDLCGFVRAVIGDDKHAHKARGIILRRYAVEQIAYHKLLVAGRYQNRISVQLRRLVRFLLFQIRHEDICKLI